MISKAIHGWNLQNKQLPSTCTVSTDNPSNDSFSYTKSWFYCICTLSINNNLFSAECHADWNICISSIADLQRIPQLTCNCTSLLESYLLEYEYNTLWSGESQQARYLHLQGWRVSQAHSTCSKQKGGRWKHQLTFTYTT
jgi:hypothetical protein